MTPTGCKSGRCIHFTESKSKISAATNRAVLILCGFRRPRIQLRAVRSYFPSSGKLADAPVIETPQLTGKAFRERAEVQ